MLNIPERLYLSGGLGTALGCSNVHGEWSNAILFKNPELINSACKRFVISGSDVIQTATYQICNLQQSSKLPRNTDQIAHDISLNNIGSATYVSEPSISTKVNIACELAQCIRKEIIDSGEFGWRMKRKLFVVGCIGPIGACLPGCQEYNGKYINDWSDNDIKNFHRARVNALKNAIDLCQVDFLAVETMPSIREALLVAHMLHGVPFYISMSCKDGKHTCYGDEVSAIVPKISEYVIAIGVNCCRPCHVLPLLQSLKDELKKEKRTLPQLVVYANNGDKYINDQVVKAKDEDKIMAYLDKWMKLGESWIGGCCGVDFDELEDIHRFINSRNLVKNNK